MFWFILGMMYFALCYFAWAMCYVAGEEDKRRGLK
jgi:hypothetical protein